MRSVKHRLKGIERIYSQLFEVARCTSNMNVSAENAWHPPAIYN